MKLLANGDVTVQVLGGENAGFEKLASEFFVIQLDLAGGLDYGFRAGGGAFAVSYRCFVWDAEHDKATGFIGAVSRLQIKKTVLGRGSIHGWFSRGKRVL